MEIGIKLKALRLQCGLTQEELANRCELTKGYISQLENELTSPSIQTLLDILSALGTTISDFFTNEKEEQVVFTEDDFFKKVADDHTITWLVPNSQKNEMEPIRIEIQPKGVLSPDMPHEGEEFGFVMSGQIVLHIGKREYLVKRGEAFYYESAKTHFLENRSTTAAVIIWVSSPPTF
ncbi:MAG: XRE family transcriptional regulator [Clostridia bacterium]